MLFAGPSRSSRPQQPSLSGNVRKCCVGTSVCCSALLIFLFSLAYIFLITSPFRADYTSLEQPSSLVMSGTLRNGLRYSILPHGSKPGRLALFGMVHVGSVDETDTELGIAHMAEHMAFDASDKHDERAGVWKQVMRLGSLFNAFTTFRNTVYMQGDVPTERLSDALELLAQQLFFSKTHNDFLQQEKGSVLSEGRFRNESMSRALEELLREHNTVSDSGGVGEGTWRIPHRFPIGTIETISSWTHADVDAFRQKHYNPDRMHLIIVGDVQPQKVRDLLEKDANCRLRQAQPSSQAVPMGKRVAIGDVPRNGDKINRKVQVAKVDGLDGLMLNVIATRSYEVHRHANNYYRVDTASKLFSLMYLASSLGRYSLHYPDSFGSTPRQRVAAAVASNEYSLGTQLRILGIVSPGLPIGGGTWRDDVAIGVLELRRLAEQGPDPTIMTVVMYVIQALLYYVEMLFPYLDPMEVAMLLMNDMDPDTVFLDFRQIREIQSQFLDLGFVEAASAHVQTEARILYDAIMGRGVSRDGAGLDAVTVSVMVPNGNVEDVSVESVNKLLQDIDKMEDPMKESPILALLNVVSSSGAPPFDWEQATSDKDLKPASPPKAGPVKNGVSEYHLANGIPVYLKPAPTGGSATIRLTAMRSIIEDVDLAWATCYVINRQPFSLSRPFSVRCEGDDLWRMDIAVAGPCLRTSSGAPVSDAEASGEGDCKTSAEEYAQIFSLARKAIMGFPMRRDDIEALATRRRVELRLLSESRSPLERLGSRQPGPWNRVGPRLIERVDAVWVSKYLRQQFSPGSMEILVAGTLTNTKDLLEMLNKYFGTLPAAPATMLPGTLDLYNTADLDRIQKRRPSLAPSDWDAQLDECFLLSTASGRSFVSMTVPAPRWNPWSAVVDGYLRMGLFDSMRRDLGYTYFVMIDAVRSVALPQESYYELAWAPPAHQVNESAAACVETLEQGHFDDDLSERIHPMAANMIQSNLGSPAVWLMLMEGVGLKAPLTWGSSPASPTVRNVEQINAVPVPVKADIVKAMQNALQGHRWSAVAITTSDSVTSDTCVLPEFAIV